MKKIVTLFTVFILLSTIGHYTVGSTNNTSDENIIADIAKNDASYHLIENVPIIGQDTRFYCTMSSLTMILNYFGFNLTKYEVFYLMGGGFSLFYISERYLKPYSSIGCGFRASNYEFVGSLFNLTIQPFRIDLQASEETEISNKLWNTIKENVSNDQPVLVNLDGLLLYVDNKLIKLPSFFWSNVPIKADHAVVVVGYDERNNSICYNDPQYSVFGEENDGAYIWIDADLFIEAFLRFNRFSPYFPSSYLVISYGRPEKISYELEEVIDQGFQRNMKRLQGDVSYYYSDIDSPGGYDPLVNYTYGVNASKELQRIFGADLQTQLLTIFLYRISGKLGIKNTLFSSIEKIFVDRFEKDISLVFDLAVPGYRNIYRSIAEEKEIAAASLRNFSSVSIIYQQCSELLQEESVLWFKIADYNRMFLNKGVFITIPKGLSLLDEMSRVMGDIIEIQEEILSLA